MVDKRLFFAIVILINISIIASYSLTSFTILYFDYNELHFFIRQFIFGISGILLIFFISQLDPDSKKVQNIMFVLLFISLLVVIVLPFLPSNLATASGGAKRWLRLGHISIAPVEFLKIGIIYFLSWSYARKVNESKKTIKHEALILIPYVITFVLIIGYIYFTQNDLGQSLICLFLLFMLAFFAGASKRIFFIGIVFVVICGIFLILDNERRIDRFLSWWYNIQNNIFSFVSENINTRINTEPYQISHSLNAIANGGFSGTGLGLGIFKLGFLSDVHTDFVLAGISEETGLLGLGVICVLYIYIIVRIFKIAKLCENKTHFIFCSGIALLLCISFLMNGFGIISLIPLKGVAVPLLSYGGSSMWSICMGLGYVLMISKKIKRNKNKL